MYFLYKEYILYKESHQVNSNEQLPKQSFNFDKPDLTATDFIFNKNRFKDMPHLNQSNFDKTNVFFNTHIEKNTFIESQLQVIIYICNINKNHLNGIINFRR